MFQDAIQAQMVIQKMSELVTDQSGSEDQLLTSITENPHSMEGSMTTTVDDDDDDDSSSSNNTESDEARETVQAAVTAVAAASTDSREDETNANLDFKSSLDSQNNVPVSTTSTTQFLLPKESHESAIFFRDVGKLQSS